MPKKMLKLPGVLELAELVGIWVIALGLLLLWLVLLFLRNGELFLTVVPVLVVFEAVLLFLWFLVESHVVAAVVEVVVD